jgi:hypothetical protein
LNPKLNILIITYYWPPSGGSGVQRWMYFSKYLKEMGHNPIVVSVDEKYASYNQKDYSLLKEIDNIETSKTILIYKIWKYNKKYTPIIYSK